MKKVLSLLLVLGALLFGLSFNGQGVYAFDPDVDDYEDLFYQYSDTYTFELEMDGMTPVVDWVRLFNFLDQFTTDMMNYDEFDDVYILTLEDYTSNIIISNVEHLKVRIDGSNESDRVLWIYGEDGLLIVGRSSDEPVIQFTGNPEDSPTSVTIEIESPVQIPSVLPWTQSYSYGRLRDYKDSHYDLYLDHDSEAGRVYITDSPSSGDANYRTWGDQWFYDASTEAYAFHSRYSNFRIVNGNGIVKDVSNVAAVYFESDPDAFDWGFFTIYYFSGEDVLKTTYHWQDLNSSDLRIEAYFYGGFRQAISGDLVFVADVEDEQPISYFLDYITAYDDIDGDISDEVYIISDDYTGFEDVLGTYEVEVGVKDSEDQESTLIFDIVVVDVTDPVVAATGTQSVSYVSTSNLTTYGASLKATATDNYYDTADLTATVHSDGYTANKSIPGTYDVVYRITDPSGNYAEHTLTITVTDPVAPEFTGGVATLSKDINEIITAAQIVATQVATDAIDGNVSASIEIISDTYTGKETTPGTWHIIIRAYDESDNMVERDITINVYSGVPGWWIPDDGPIIIPNGSELTLDQIIAVLVSVNWIDEELAPTVTLLSSDYFGNENKPGEYKLNLLIDGTPTQFDLLVLNAGDDWFPDVQTPVVEASFNWYALTLGIAVLGVFAVGSIYIFRKKK